MPQGIYTRPASIVYLGYLQPMTDAPGRDQNLTKAQWRPASRLTRSLP
jgi:hypothetical protein